MIAISAADRRELTRRNPWGNLQVPALYAIWIGAAAVAIATSSLPLRLAAWFIAGAALQGLGIMMHEAVHYLMFKSRRLNHLAGLLCGLPTLMSVTAYRVGHMPHHRYERSARDPDELENLSRDPRVLSLLFLAVFAAGWLFGAVRIGPANALRVGGPARRAIVAEHLLIVAALASAVAVLPWSVFLNGWLIPALIALQLTNVRTLAEHVLTGAGDRALATRTVTSNRFVSYFMCNLNYHTAHHLFQGVPWYRLPRLHALIEPELRRIGARQYASYTRFLADLFVFALRAWSPGGRTLPLELPVRHHAAHDRGLQPRTA